ncbi:MAG TPA: globin [Aggregatilineales bacterium]|nr:globin [Aggregatilineales bacterium]
MEEGIQTVYAQLGEDGFTRLIAAFYRRVAEDAVLRAVYPEQDLSGAERRLRMFLIQYFGGPDLYSAERGHPRLRLRHQPFRIGQVERDRWITAMLSAMAEVKIPEPAHRLMRDYFENGATFLMNVPSAPDRSSNS